MKLGTYVIDEKYILDITNIYLKNQELIIQAERWGENFSLPGNYQFVIYDLDSKEVFRTRVNFPGWNVYDGFRLTVHQPIKLTERFPSFE